MAIWSLMIQKKLRGTMPCAHLPLIDSTYAFVRIFALFKFLILVITYHALLVPFQQTLVTFMA